MKLFISILFNALILFVICYIMPIAVKPTDPGIYSAGGLTLYFVGGLFLGILNYVVRPILKLIGLPFLMITFGLFILVINGFILFLLQNIIKILIPESGINGTIIYFQINGLSNFIIAVAIFSIFNTIYNTFLKK